MKKWLLKWWPLLAWVAFAALVNLAAAYQVIPYKLYEFLFLFWIGASIIGSVPIGLGLLAEMDARPYERRRAALVAEHNKPFVPSGIVRVFDWKSARMVELPTTVKEPCDGKESA